MTERGLLCCLLALSFFLFLQGFAVGKWQDPKDVHEAGPWVAKYPNGQVMSEGAIEFDPNAGAERWHERDQTLELVFDLREGGVPLAEPMRGGLVRVGPWVFYAEDGSKQDEGRYFRGRRVGFWTRYHTNGKIAARGAWIAGRQQGKHEVFREDGTRQARYTYRFGLRQGPAWLYDIRGDVFQVGNYMNNNRSGVWSTYQGPFLRSRGTFEAGREKGAWIFFYQQGEFEAQGDFLNGLQHGAWVGYHPDGKVRFSGSFRQGKPHGPWSMYWPSGLLQASGEMVQGQRQGYWKQWDLFRRPDPERSGLYVDDELVR